jgi:hypothetical protein
VRGSAVQALVKKIDEVGPRFLQLDASRARTFHVFHEDLAAAFASDAKGSRGEDPLELHTERMSTLLSHTEYQQYSDFVQRTVTTFLMNRHAPAR